MRSLLFLTFAIIASLGSGGEPPRERRVLMFTSHTCFPCITAKRECEEWMRPSGWTFGDTSESHVQYVDDAELVERFNVERLPTFILIYEGKEVKRQAGYDLTRPLEVRRRVIVDMYSAKQ